MRKVSRSLPCKNIRSSCRSLGAVELPLYCAQEVDADENGYQFWLAGRPENDPRSEALGRRLRCYDLVLDSLSVFGERCVVRQPKPSADNGAVEVRDFAYTAAFASEDPVFHSHLYTWMIENSMADALLEVICSPIYQKQLTYFPPYRSVHHI